MSVWGLFTYITFLLIAAGGWRICACVVAGVSPPRFSKLLTIPRRMWLQGEATLRK